ncbi:DUF4328 domain-containing protein [Nonomuraea endophytica]|uniref:DUF4328 domain-containing protein n=1 Tax=Nonomuraea endophytica TaxID=714136 RepID=UPI001C847F83|nr:DUF4328 domain-containing protein [Nonomuraea endophytica]
MHPLNPMRRVRPVRGAATLAVALLVADSVVGLAAAGIDLWVAGLMDQVAADPFSVTEAELTWTDVIWAGSGLVEMAARLAAIAAFLFWLFRARDNAEALSPEHHQHSRTWLVLGWLVPVVNLWFPKQIVDDIWIVSTPGRVQGVGLIHARRPGLVWAWWLAWLCGWLGSNVAGRLLFAGEDPEDLARAARFDVVGIALYWIAAALAIAVILRITAMQEAGRTAVNAGYSPSHPVA